MINEEKKGYIIDFISGVEVKTNPEEIEAVQVFAKQLVEDYSYPKECIQTRPQFRVRARPSDIRKEYPVDIAVFTNEEKQEDDVYIIIECKKKNRKDGKNQLQDYLRFSRAFLGVWFNGEERLFLRKIERDGRIEFEEIPNIPMFGQRVEDIGKFKRKDLKTTHNLKATFKAIRNHLAANTVGTTRDEVLAQQLINLIFCKIYDEKFTAPEEIVTFRAGIGEDVNLVKERIINFFNDVKLKYKEVLDFNDTITLDANSVAYVVGELQNYCLIEAERDVIADAFETFIGHALKGGLGQFFTPRNVVKMMVEILDPDLDDLIIDPACGSGGFLVEALKYVWQKVDKKANVYNWQKNEIEREKQKISSTNFRGIDKDYFLSKVTKAYMTLIGDGTSGTVCDDSLETQLNWSQATKNKVQLESFNVVLTNPPFGSKIPVRGEDKLKQFDLGHKWKKGKNSNLWEKGKLKDKEAPQILFIERCLQLLKDGGRMSIVLPDGVFGNESLAYLRNWLLKKSRIIAIIDVPIETFMPNTSTKTTILFLKKEKNKEKNEDYPIFMAVAETCGHDRRGKETSEDQISAISNEFKIWQKDNSKFNSTENYFSVNLSDFINYDLWTPKYLFPRYLKPIKQLKQRSISTIKIGEIFSFTKGVEVGSNNYVNYLLKTESDLPFIRTSDLVNYTLNRTSDLHVDESLLNTYNIDLKKGDILFTKDGKIGMVAIVAKDTNFLISSGIARCRLKANKVKEIYRKYGVKINSKYVFSLLINREIGLYQALRRTVVAATIPHLNMKRLKDIEIPLLEQSIIDEASKKVRKIMQLESRRNALIESIKKDIAEEVMKQ